MSDSESEEVLCTSPELHTLAKNVAQDRLPSKSKKYYEAAYEKFVKWKKNNKAITTENCILVYFNEMAKKLKPKTMWCQYSMLKHTLKLKENIDIKDFHHLTSKLRNDVKGYGYNKANVFEASKVEKFLKDAPDEIYLATKVSICTVI